ncbi:hypothetical protein EJB05_16126 [Eragrostis curvula]|uniref:Uncharacterized protein n=1 Tax=Eragrostis curvula TaxID=38414 RepID=A0A5J9VEB4_9POAL|nr:hypothetical protein EJB05_16126 [Eragrostis curvula]
MGQLHHAPRLSPRRMPRPSDSTPWPSPARWRAPPHAALLLAAATQKWLMCPVLRIILLVSKQTGLLRRLFPSRQEAPIMLQVLRMIGDQRRCLYRFLYLDENPCLDYAIRIPFHTNLQVVRQEGELVCDSFVRAELSGSVMSSAPSSDEL